MGRSTADARRSRGVVARRVIAAWLLAGSAVVTAVTASSAPAGAQTAPAGLVSLTPARLLDTRAGGSTVDGRFAGIGAQATGPGALAVTGRGGVPSTGVAAVVVNVTVDNSGRAERGFVTVYPTGSPRPTASSLNFSPGSVVANELIAKVSAGGEISIFTQAPTHVIVDVVGWFPAATSSVFPLEPARVVDTRADGVTIDGLWRGEGPLTPSRPLAVRVAGRHQVPSGVAAVVMNVTVVNDAGSGEGFVSVYPSDSARPTASSLNFAPGQVVANELVARVSADGYVTLFASSQVHVVVDVVGYFVATGDPGYNGLVPARLMDTRFGRPLPSKQSYPLIVLGRGGVPASGVSAVVLNITVDHSASSTSGFVTVSPEGVSRPTASSLNFSPGAIVPNEIVAKVGSGGRISIYVSAGAHVIVDVVGWFGTAGGDAPPGDTTPGTTTPGGTTPGGTTPVPESYTQVQAVYAVPSDRSAVSGRPTAIAHEVDVVQDWYDAQTGGRHPVFVRSGGSVSVQTVSIPLSSAQLLADDDAHYTIEAAVLAALPGLSASTALAIVYEGQAAGNSYCGVEIGRTVLMVVENCGGIPPSASSVWPGGMSYLLGHELTHLLGAVPSCAPHSSAGHVSDDRRDVLYQGPLGRDWLNLTLDPGRDDYYQHGRTDCFDIDDSPLLGTG